jgi:hypothetical protein
VFLDLVTATAGDPNNNNNTNTNNNTMSLTLANSGTTAFNDANAAFPRRQRAGITATADVILVVVALS